MFDFLSSNTSAFIDSIEDFNPSQIGSSVKFYNEADTDEQFDFMLICINETRGNPNKQGQIDFETLKHQFYTLNKGNWNLSILDMGVVDAGSETSDTYFAVKTLVKYALKQKSIPIVLGGSQDLLYHQYRGYDGLKYMVNLVNIDFKFDLGDSNSTLHHESFLSHMVVDKPYNLFNYANLGYQTFLNTQEEISLLGKMFFEAYRLGEMTTEIKKVEPILRDADLVSIDMRCIESQSLAQDNLFPNGFNNREICALSRYAGLSDKVSSLGIYELQYLKSNVSKGLVAQFLWYFVEGVKYRLNEKADVDNPNLIKYKVPVEDDVLVFYESQLSGRWWIEIPSNFDNVNNKLKQHSLLPCDKENYLSACNQELPERWIKARKKNEF